MTDEPINWSLIERLAGKPHKHLNIGTCNRDTCDAGHDHIGTGEVLQEARTAHHLFDLIGIPEGWNYSAHLDVRAWRAIRRIQAAEERLERIATWHARETAAGGMVGDYCTECGEKWPCDTRRMADGTYIDEQEQAA